MNLLPVINSAGLGFSFGSEAVSHIYRVNRYCQFRLESLGGCDRWMRALVIGIERWQVTGEVVAVKIFVDPKENSFMPDSMADGYYWVCRPECDRLMPIE